MSSSVIGIIIVIVVILLFLISGYRKGFLRIILSALSLVITILLCNAFSAQVADYIENNTAIGPRIQEWIEDNITEQLSGISASVSDAQDSLIDSLPLTDSMKDSLKENNTAGNYADQGVSTFTEYLAVNLTTLLVRVISYVILFIVISLILHLILRLSSLFNKIPIVGGINKVAGAIIGLAEAMVILWIFCLIIMAASTTQFGQTCQEAIEGSKLLTWIYENNYLMKVLSGEISFLS